MGFPSLNVSPRANGFLSDSPVRKESLQRQALICQAGSLSHSAQEGLHMAAVQPGPASKPKPEVANLYGLVYEHNMSDSSLAGPEVQELVSTVRAGADIEIVTPVVRTSLLTRMFLGGARGWGISTSKLKSESPSPPQSSGTPTSGENHGTPPTTLLQGGLLLP